MLNAKASTSANGKAFITFKHEKLIDQGLANPLSNGIFVRLEIHIVISHSTVTITWHASVLHFLNLYIFESVDEIWKKLVAVSLNFLYDFVHSL